MSTDDIGAVKHFDKEKSEKYDDMIRCVIPGYEAMHDMARHMLKESLGKKADLLIVGAGTGRETVAIAEEEAGWLITAVDPSEAMISVAVEKVKSKGLDDRVVFNHGYVTDLGSEKSYDAATSILVMHFIPDDGAKESYLKEIGKRLKKGGKLVLVDLGGDKHSATYKQTIEVWKNYQKGVRSDPENVDKDFEQIHKDVHPATEERTFELLNGTGFADIERFYQAWLFRGYVATKLW